MGQSVPLRDINRLYRMMTSVENNIGGGEGVEGLYGSITGTHMERVLRSMEKLTGLHGGSVVMDVGSGLCRPLVHALATGRASVCVGVEVDEVKCVKADAFCAQVKKNIVAKNIKCSSSWDIDIVCCGVESMETLNPVTHVYSFWEGVPGDAREGLGRLFQESLTAQAICVVQRAMRCDDPAEYMNDMYGFGPLELRDSFRVTMSGSGRSFMAYVFVKKEQTNMIKRMFQEERPTKSTIEVVPKKRKRLNRN